MKAILDWDNYIFAIIANKNDLKNNAVVSEEEGEKYAKEKKAIFKSISAKEDKNEINKLFDTLIDELRKINYEADSSIVLTETHFNKKKKHEKRTFC